MCTTTDSPGCGLSHTDVIYKVVIRCVQLQTVQDVAFLTPMSYIQGGYQMCTTTDSPGCGLSHTDVVYTRWLSDVYNPGLSVVVHI